MFSPIEPIPPVPYILVSPFSFEVLRKRLSKVFLIKFKKRLKGGEQRLFLKQDVWSL
jgi:hypothetical protein